jgi:hypothetical protein
LISLWKKGRRMRGKDYIPEDRGGETVMCTGYAEKAGGMKCKMSGLGLGNFSGIRLVNECVTKRNFAKL